MIWFSYFLTEYKQEGAKITPFCFAEGNLNFQLDIRFYFDIKLVCLFVKELFWNSTCFLQHERTISFLIQQESYEWEKFWDSSHLPCHFSYQHTQPPFISKDNAPASMHPGTKSPTGVCQLQDKKPSNKSVRGHKQYQDCTCRPATARLAIVLTLSCCGYRETCLSTWLWTHWTRNHHCWSQHLFAHVLPN